MYSSLLINIEQRNRHLCRLAAAKNSDAGKLDENTASETLQPIRVLMKDSPYAEVDPPWQSPLLGALSPASYDPQAKSPIFTKLVPELRSQIFSYVLAEYEDWSDEYRPEQAQDGFTFCVSYRPGWMAPWVRELALLYTCRRVYYEARHLPMQLTTHRWCLDPTRRRDTVDGSHSVDNIGRLKVLDLTMQNLENLTNIHVLCSRMWLQDLRKTALSSWEMWRGPDPFPNLETFTVTIGWSRWYPYDAGEFDYEEFELDDWPEVKKCLRLEFEVATCPSGHVECVDEMVRELRSGKIEFETINGTPLVADVSKDKPLKWKWLLELPEDVDGDDYNLGTRGVGLNHPNPLELEVTVVDFVPGRPPRLRKDLDL